MRRDEGIDGFAALLGKAGLELGAEEVADALWLARHINPGVRKQVVKEEDLEDHDVEPTIREEYLDSELEDEGDDEAELPLSLPQKQDGAESDAVKPDGVPIKAPAAPALRIKLELARALRPLRRHVPSPVKMEFDQAATIKRIADQGIWSPVLSPAPERWLDVALVIEESKSAPLWKETLVEFQTLLERQGAFRRVSSWQLRSDDVGELTLLSKQSNRPRSARELVDSTGRRLILVVSDCTSLAWQRGKIYPWLETWGEQALMAVIQLLPERLWAQTGLAHGVPMWLSALEPGVPSAQMIATAQMPLWNLFEPEQEQVTVPVVSLEVEPLNQWAKVISGIGENRTVGFQFNKRENLEVGNQEPEEQLEMSAEERVQLFRATASLTAQKLAGLMSAASVSPPIVDLIRQTMLPEAEPVHIAEVYMGGLMESHGENQYDFDPDVRDLLADTLSIKDTERVLDRVSSYVSKHLGLNTHSFEALLCLNLETNSVNELLVPFAHVTKQVLHRIGGDYASILKRMNTSNSIEQQKKGNKSFSTTWVPPLQKFSFREAIIEFEDQSLILAEIERYSLTDREAEVWKLRQQGTSYKEISKQLFISVNTVKKHLKNIFTKIARIENTISPEDFNINETSIWGFIQSERQYTLEELSRETGIDIEQLIQHINNIVNKIESRGNLRALIVVGYDSNTDLENQSLETIKPARKAQFLKTILELALHSAKNKIDILLEPSVLELKNELKQGNYNLFFYSGYSRSKSDSDLLSLKSEISLEITDLAKLLTKYLIKVAVIDTTWNIQTGQNSQNTITDNILVKTLSKETTLTTIITTQNLYFNKEVQNSLRNLMQNLTEFKSGHSIPNAIQLLLDESFKVLKVDAYNVSVREAVDGGKVFPICQGIMRIGRLPDNDLVISEPWVSSKHAEISYRRQSESEDSLPTYFLHDFSRYGTYYFSPHQGWQQMHRQQIPLSSGMKLRFGSSDGCLWEFLIEPKFSKK